MISAAQASIRCERTSPPDRPGARLPEQAAAGHAGEYIITAFHPGAKNEPVRFIIDVQKRSWFFFIVVSALGGLAIFIYGMSKMGDGLQRLGGSGLERIIGKLTVNRFMAILVGSGITAIIQSSSATTVMVVGLINAGIMTLAQSIGIIIGIMLLVMLGQLGIEITTLIAAMGIGGLAIALALQPTLSNFFSGMQMIFDRPIKIGDFVELDSGDKGTVVDIGWRSTRIRTYLNNIVTIPNGVLAAQRAGIFVVAVPNPLTRQLKFPPADLMLATLADFSLMDW